MFKLFLFSWLTLDPNIIMGTMIKLNSYVLFLEKKEVLILQKQNQLIKQR